ncbi:MAG: flagellar protein FlgN [Bilophila sp.]
MYDIIRGNLDRQAKGIELLRQLLDEEFSLLMDRKTSEVMSLEFSIHELVRQLAGEKIGVQTALGGGKVRDYADMLEEDKRATLHALWSAIDKCEQHCSRQASLNAELSLALLDQSKSMLTYLHKRIQPQTPSTYTRAGGYLNKRPEAALISGRM